MAPAPARSPAPVRSTDDLLRGARGGTIFAAVLTAGFLQPGDEKDVGGVVEKFAKNQLHLDRARVRVLNVRIDAGTSGAEIRRLVFLVLAGLFGAFTLLGLARMRILRARIRAEGTSP